MTQYQSSAAVKGFLNCRIMSRQNGRVIFLDAGDTLVFARRTMHEAIVEICRREGLTVEEEFVRRTAIEIKPTLGPVSTLNLDSFRGWWMRLYKELLLRCDFRGDIAAAQRELWGIWRSGKSLRLFPDTRDALERLREMGCRLSVISNWDDTLENVLDNLDLGAYLEHVFCSYSLGLEKPDPRIFEHALKTVGLQDNPAGAWHVGDSLEKDVQGAGAVGIRPILIDYFNKYEGNDMEVPVARSLFDVVGIVAQEGPEGQSREGESPDEPFVPKTEGRLIKRFA